MIDMNDNKRFYKIQMTDAMAHLSALIFAHNVIPPLKNSFQALNRSRYSSCFAPLIFFPLPLTPRLFFAST